MKSEADEDFVFNFLLKWFTLKDILNFVVGNNTNLNSICLKLIKKFIKY